MALYAAAGSHWAALYAAIPGAVPDMTLFPNASISVTPEKPDGGPKEPFSRRGVVHRYPDQLEHDGRTTQD